jgi:adhesin transport system outer membrane protein
MTRRPARRPRLARGLHPVRLLMLATLAATFAWPPAAAQLPTSTPASVRTDPASAGERQAGWLLRAAEPVDPALTQADRQALRLRIAQALATHPEWRAASAAALGARAAQRETEAGGRPQLSLDAETGRRHGDASTLQNTTARTYGTGSVGLTLRQQVFDFGALDAQVEASAAFAEGVELRAAGRRADLALRAVQATLEQARSQRQLTLTQLLLDAREELARDLEERHRLGGGTISDVWRARSRVAEARGSLAQAQARDASNAAAYQELLGQAPPAELPILRPEPLDATALANAPAAVVTDFPTLQASLAAVRTAEAERQANQARERPRIELELGAQRRDLIGSLRPGTDWQAGLQLRHSFYSGGADRAREAQALARVDEASEQLRGTRWQLERALLQALADERSGDAVLAARHDALRLAVDALRGVREQFLNRRGSLLDLMNAQDTLHSAGLSWLEADVARAGAQWRLAYLSSTLLRWVDSAAR